MIIFYLNLETQPNERFVLKRELMELDIDARSELFVIFMITFRQSLLQTNKNLITADGAERSINCSEKARLHKSSSNKLLFNEAIVWKKKVWESLASFVYLFCLLFYDLKANHVQTRRYQNRK